MKKWILPFVGMTILAILSIRAFAATGVVVEQGGGLYFVTQKKQKIIPKMGEEFYDGYKVYNTKGRVLLLLFYGDLIELNGQQTFQTGKDSVKPKPYLPPPYTALEDAINVAKMGPVGLKAKLSMHPPKGYIQGLYPINGTIFPTTKIIFEWKGKDVFGEKPTFFFFEDSKNPKYKIFSITTKTKRLELSAQELGLEEGKTYHWFLGRLEEWPKSQSQVYSFQILSTKDEARLNHDFKTVDALHISTKEGEDFLKANIFYHYQMIHDMINLLQPIYTKRPSRSLRRLLFLGYVRLGRPVEATKYEEKN